MNPLEIILDDIAALRAERGPSFRWATVTNVEPLRVRLDGDEHELPIEPGSVATAAVDDRVLCLIDERRITVIGNGTAPGGGGVAEPFVEYVGDANDAVEGGITYIATLADNLPVTSAALFAFPADDTDAITQVAYRLSTNPDNVEQWSRIFDGSSWGDWVQTAGPGLTPNRIVSIDDWNDADTPGFYYGPGSAANKPPDGVIHQGLVLGGNAGQQLSQLAFRGMNSDSPTVWFRIRLNSGDNAGDWGDWHQLYPPQYSPGSQKIVAGRDAITPTPNTATSTWVWFGGVSEKVFDRPPSVVVTPITSVPGTVVEMSVNGIDEYGFTAWIMRSSSTRTSFCWQAVGQ